MISNTGNPYRIGLVVVAPPGRVRVFELGSNEIADLSEFGLTDGFEFKKEEAAEETVTEQMMTKSEP